MFRKRMADRRWRIADGCWLMIRYSQSTTCYLFPYFPISLFPCYLFPCFPVSLFSALAIRLVNFHAHDIRAASRRVGQREMQWRELIQVRHVQIFGDGRDPMPELLNCHRDIGTQTFAHDGVTFNAFERRFNPHPIAFVDARAFCHLRVQHHAEMAFDIFGDIGEHGNAYV